MKNLNIDQKIALGLMISATAALGYIAVLAFLSDRKYKKTIKKINLETELDLEAIRLTGEEMAERLKTYTEYRYSWQIQKDFDDLLKFNRIAVRNK